MKRVLKIQEWLEKRENISVLAPFKSKIIWEPGIVYAPFIPLIETEKWKK